MNRKIKQVNIIDIINDLKKINKKYRTYAIIKTKRFRKIKTNDQINTIIVNIKTKDKIIIDALICDLKNSVFSDTNKKFITSIKDTIKGEFFIILRVTEIHRIPKISYVLNETNPYTKSNIKIIK